VLLAWAFTCQWRSGNSAKRQPKTRVSTMRWNLKEVGGKTLTWQTEITYKAYACRWVCITKQSPKLFETGGVSELFNKLLLRS